MGCRVKGQKILFLMGGKWDERVKNFFLMGGLRGEGVLYKSFLRQQLKKGEQQWQKINN
ncbi:hypothetical protein X926_01660 [Petrotoga sp. HWHPT.55.6.3]|nr:hypothetical protein X926_01660 [Petrotoga sp. HWHPT.55.6.3]